MISIYTANEARIAAETFYGPLGQIFETIRERSKDGLYVLKVSGTELSEKQISVLERAGYKVSVDVETLVYTIDWS